MYGLGGIFGHGFLACVLGNMVCLLVICVPLGKFVPGVINHYLAEGGGNSTIGPNKYLE